MHHVADECLALGAAGTPQTFVEQASASLEEGLLRLHALLAEALTQNHDRGIQIAPARRSLCHAFLVHTRAARTTADLVVE
jgi:hypothetical protein